MQKFEIEIEETEDRKDFNEQERRRTFTSSKQLVEDAKQVEEVLRTKSPKPSGAKGGRPSKPASTRAVAEAVGVDAKSVRKAEQHVETAEAFPFMQGPDWRQSQVLAVRESIEKLPEVEKGSIYGSRRRATKIRG